MAILFSCKKEKSMNISVPTEHVRFRTDSCQAIKDSVYKSGDMLVFQDMEHFEKCALCLEYDYDAYNDQYDAQYPNATAEELDSLDIINNFDQWTPYLEFEDGLSFSSLRAKIEEETMQWLASTPADSIDFEDDPDNSVPVYRKSYRALMNEDGFAKVGSDTISSSDWGNHSLDNCSWLNWTTITYGASQDPVLEGRKITMQVGVKSGIVLSGLWGQIRHLKKNTNGKFVLTRANLKIYIYGLAYNGECEPLDEFWANNDGYKKRSALQVTDDISWAWREALTNDLHDDFSLAGCRAFGYWESDSNDYPVWLVQ